MAQIIKIGNSQGVRIPKPIVSIANLENQELDFVVLNEGLLITPEKKSRIYKNQLKECQKSLDKKKYIIF